MEVKKARHFLKQISSLRTHGGSLEMSENVSSSLMRACKIHVLLASIVTSPSVLLGGPLEQVSPVRGERGWGEV